MAVARLRGRRQNAPAAARRAGSGRARTRTGAPARTGRNCRPEVRGARAAYERLSSMAFWSIWSAVVTTLLLD